MRYYYVIIKYLFIECIRNIKVEHTIDIEYKYYDLDIKDSNIDKEWKKYTQTILSPVNKEIIYEDGVWFNTEYISMLPEEVCFKDIVRINVIEKRNHIYESFIKSEDNKVVEVDSLPIYFNRESMKLLDEWEF